MSFRLLSSWTSSRSNPSEMVSSPSLLFSLPISLGNCLLLESLAGFFHVVNRKSLAAVAELRAATRALDHEAQKKMVEYRSRVVMAKNLLVLVNQADRRGWSRRIPRVAIS